MKNLSRAEKAAICLTLLFLAFTAGYFVGKSTASTVITFAGPEAPQLAAPDSAPASPDSTQPSLSGAKPLALPGNSDSTEAPSGGRVNINTATKEELETLPGIGPALAQRIIDYRQQHGPFETPADIMDVSGIGEKKFNAIRDMITTGG